MLSLRDGVAGATLGSLTLDGSDPALPPGRADLRWVILDEALQGRGWGRRLMGAAMGFARESGCASVYLTTFEGLDAAAALYRAFGFETTHRVEGATWGRTVMELVMEAQL